MAKPPIPQGGCELWTIILNTTNLMRNNKLVSMFLYMIITGNIWICRILKIFVLFLDKKVKEK